jgi:hypothetical protein
VKLALHFVFAVALLSRCSGQVVDRIVAVVNKQVILQSEWQDAAHLELVLKGKTPAELSSEEMGAVLDRMIDQVLVQEQIVDPSALEPNAGEISAQIQELRAHIPDASADGSWQAMLAAYGLTQQDVERYLASQIRVLKFIDLRFRAQARVERASISEYYQQKLVPQLEQQGAPVPPLDQVADKIRQVLTEQRINELLNSWLQALRLQARIEKLTAEKLTVDSHGLKAGAKP